MPLFSYRSTRLVIPCLKSKIHAYKWPKRNDVFTEPLTSFEDTEHWPDRNRKHKSKLGKETSPRTLELSRLQVSHRKIEESCNPLKLSPEAPFLEPVPCPTPTPKPTQKSWASQSVSVFPVANDSCLGLCCCGRESWHFLGRAWNMLKWKGKTVGCCDSLQKAGLEAFTLNIH